MKIKESPSIILAFHGMLGRKKQTSLLLLLLTLVFSFLTAAVIYSCLLYTSPSPRDA